ncbi:hypothetical protein [Bradyrhizobium sp. UFLA03-84]|uniref:hypothetical protein n=1 Tax=Bradyrhizobium sp. UFLA03-84 TaxID=418599 RepID=UPI00117785E6|nr:hypothetical protein [Bradyrhizobium sp. UFLA03-84]
MFRFVPSGDSQFMIASAIKRDRKVKSRAGDSTRQWQHNVSQCFSGGAVHLDHRAGEIFGGFTPKRRTHYSNK